VTFPLALKGQGSAIQNHAASPPILRLLKTLSSGAQGLQAQGNPELSMVVLDAISVPSPRTFAATDRARAATSA
jgi:hypothetical protein